MRIGSALFLFAILALIPCTLPAQQAVTAHPRGTGKLQVLWLGHSAFEIISPGGTHLLIDPFLKDNPSTPSAFKDLKRYRPNAILVTHSHSDHAADALEIAKASGAPVIGTSEWVATLGLPASQQMGGGVGGTFTVGDVTIHLVPAVHSSEPSGRPLGFVMTFSDGQTIYHTGDTWLFQDMALIQELYHPTILMICAGGGPYTEDPKTAALAVKKYFSPRTIIPMHYATFPQLATEAEVKAAFSGDKRLRVMHPGETAIF